MITQTEIKQAEAAVDESDTSGLRRVCMCCKADLPGSNPNAVRATNGLCSPLCAEAVKLGWGQSNTKP
jgi:hypothetical protein